MLDGLQILKTHTQCASDYQPVPLDTGTEVYTSHVSVNIRNYCTQSQ